MQNAAAVPLCGLWFAISTVQVKVTRYFISAGVPLRRWGDSLTIVLCIVPGCSKCSGATKSFYRIPKIVKGRGFKKEQLSKQCRAGYLAAIRRKGLMDKIISNDRVCSRYLVTGKPAPLEDDVQSDWLLTQHLTGGNPHQQMSCNLIHLVLRPALRGMKD